MKVRTFHYLCYRKFVIMKERLLLTILLCLCVFSAEAQRRPVIGISDIYKDNNSAAVPRSYVDAILMSGGLPVIIPLMSEDEKIIELLNTLDGIVFTGGEDFDPSYYNERPIPQMGKINASRDVFDIRLLHLAVDRGMPVLGICRGIQLINIAFGGSLYQDIPAQYSDRSVRHRQTQAKEEASHSVIVEDNTVFAEIVQDRMLMVNSSHHQSVKTVAPGFRVAGRSSDKLVEVIEKIDSENWILGVQFHPEVRMHDNAMRKIIRYFIDEAGKKENPHNRVREAFAMRRFRDSEEPISPMVIKPQFVYKTDTVYISLNEPPNEIYYIDTVYMLVRDTVFMDVPSVTNIVYRDTVYINVPPVTQIYRDTVYLEAPVANLVYTENENLKKATKETEKVEKERLQAAKEFEESSKVTEKERAKAIIKAEKEALKIANAEAKIAEKAKDREMKEARKVLKIAEKEKAKAEKDAAKIAKKAVAEKEDQYRKEQMEKAKQLKKENKKE